MKKALIANLVAAAAIFPSCTTTSAFTVVRHYSAPTDRHRVVSCQAALRDENNGDYYNYNEPSSSAGGGHNNHLVLGDRRSAISNILASIPLGILATSVPFGAAAEDNSKGKIVVMGGSGWVGAHVVSNLQKRGYRPVSISRSSPEVQIQRTQSILGTTTTLPNVEYLSLDAKSASIDDLSSIMKDSLAVISCVGISPGSSNQKDGNGLVNSRIVQAAKSAGVPRFVYIGVASSLVNGPAKFLLGDYFQGKAEAEKSVSLTFGNEDSLIIKPAIVAGGTPGELRPPGPPGVKPADVEAVAALAVAGALGKINGNIDGNEDIAAMAAP